MNTQIITSDKNKKYEYINEYLKQDDSYWLVNDKWELTSNLFIGKTIKGAKYINYSYFENEYIKNEIKYFILFYFKEYDMRLSLLSFAYRFKHLGRFLKKYYNNINSIEEIQDKNALFLKWTNYLLSSTIKTQSSLDTCKSFLSLLYDFFVNPNHKNVDETENDIWLAKNIPGAITRVTQDKHSSCLDFTRTPKYYRETVKRYFKTIITKKSFSHCRSILVTTDCFFSTFYEMGYTDGFLKKLSREDIEKYLYNISNKYKGKNVTYVNKFIAYPRTFLEYIQMAQYDKAPEKEISFLIYQNDIPRRERDSDRLQRVKFIPEPILRQLDNNIMSLNRPQFIPVYILLRETGWRGTDILNLRYNNCLEQIWNSKENKYNYYLCGEITKTGIAQLKIPIRAKVAEMVQNTINKTKEYSIAWNINPEKYLFITNKGRGKGNPLSKAVLINAIKALIKEKDIRDTNGELYKFKTHSLRHTRAKEYIEQGMGISIIQQILGHRSLQMTIHYATVTENTLYEKWKATEELDLFRVNTETHELQQVVLDSDDGESLIRYEYVKKNLDAVKVPFGVCFKPSKLPCKQQMNHCLSCASFCTTTENIPEYEEEIDRVKKQIEISDRCGRELWSEKNKQYLDILEKTLKKVKEQKLVHKNSGSREEL